MKSTLLSAAVLAAAALTSVAASADTFNPYLWDQMKTPSTRTRAEVKAEVLQDRQAAAPAASGSAYNGAIGQPKPGAPKTGQADAAPQAATEMVKTSQQ